MGSVYKLDFLSGKSYIGATTQKLSARIRRHELAAINGKANFAIHKAWREFGKPTVMLLAEVENEFLLAEEIKAIAKYGTMVPHGYNLTSGGRRTKFSEQSKTVKSEGMLGRVFSLETKAKMSLAQRNRDPGTRHYLGPIWEGKKQSPDHIAKRIRKAGWKHSEETKAKLSEAATKRVMNNETKEKIALSLKSRNFNRR